MNWKRFILILWLSVATSRAASTNTIFWLFNSLGNQPDATHLPAAVFIPPDNTFYQTNVSISGKTWIELQNSITNNTSIVPNRNLTGSNWVICLENGNSIFFGSNQLLTIISSSNCLKTVKAHTNFVILCTAPFRGDLSLSQSNDLNAVNDYQRLHFRSMGADGLIDLSTNVLLNPYLHPENFQSDHLHWNAAGALIATQQIAAQWPGNTSEPIPAGRRYRIHINADVDNPPRRYRFA